MKERLWTLLKTYLLLVLLFMVQKPLFMLFYIDMYVDCPAAEWGRVIWHGLPLDFSVAGYLTSLPALLLVASVWTCGRWLTWPGHRVPCLAVVVPRCQASPHQSSNV